MSIPGVNLLGLALSVIQKQTVRYYRATGRTTNAAGKLVTTFAAGVGVVGSFQPVNVSLIQQYGLEMGRSYAMFYGFQDFRPVERNNAPDQFGYAGRRYDAIGAVPWLAQDGWESVLLVDVGPDAG